MTPINPLGKDRELDVLAVIYCQPLESERGVTEEQEHQLWEIFGNECLLSMGNGTGRDYPQFNARRELEKRVPLPPSSKPSWHLSKARKGCNS